MLHDATFTSASRSQRAPADAVRTARRRGRVAGRRGQGGAEQLVAVMQPVSEEHSNTSRCGLNWPDDWGSTPSPCESVETDLTPPSNMLVTPVAPSDGSDTDWGYLDESFGEPDRSWPSSDSHYDSSSGDDFLSAAAAPTAWAPQPLLASETTDVRSTGDKRNMWCELWSDDSSEAANRIDWYAPLPADEPTTVDVRVLRASGAFGVPHAPSAEATAPTHQCADVLPTSLQGMLLERLVATTRTDEQTASYHEPPLVEKPQVCPICHADAGDSLNGDGSTMKMANIFAQYVRTKPRTNNPLAPWYAKRGYRGPPYCKACAESLSSHLLKKVVRSNRAACSRESPCARCEIILGHFDIPKEQLFSDADERTARARVKRAQMQMKRKPPPQPNNPPDVSLTKRKRLAAVASVTVAVITLLLVAGRYRNNSAYQPAQRDSIGSNQPGWVCGVAAADSLLNATSSGRPLASACDGMSKWSTFPCENVDDCGAGQVPIGQRRCRCDGCFQTGGRCAGWALAGYGPSPTESGCEAIQPDPEPYVWNVPGNLTSDQCSDLCAEAKGCYRSEGNNENLLAEHQGPPQRAQCELFFARAWPQPQTQSWSSGAKLPYYAQNGATLYHTPRSGVIWTDYRHSQQNAAGALEAGIPGDIWYYTIDDGGFRGKVSDVDRDYSIEPVLSPSVDLHIMWHFDAVKMMWRAVPSSLRVRPAPRAGAGRWADSSGSLFLLGGLSMEEEFESPSGVQPFSYVEYSRRISFPDNSRRVGPYPGTPMELWKYDTRMESWHPLHPDRASGRALGWPAARTGAAVWRERALMHAPGSDFGSSETPEKIWVFGGWQTATDCGIGSELWQYTYIDDQHLSDSGSGAGQWSLVMNSVRVHRNEETTRLPDTWVEPLYFCTNGKYDAVANRGSKLSGSTQNGIVCPPERKDAGSWASPKGGKGKFVAVPLFIRIAASFLEHIWLEPVALHVAKNNCCF